MSGEDWVDLAGVGNWLAVFLRFQVHPPQQVVEARVVAEGVKLRPNIGPLDTVALVKGVVQQFNGPIFVTKHGVKSGFHLRF